MGIAKWSKTRKRAPKTRKFDNKIYKLATLHGVHKKKTDANSVVTYLRARGISARVVSFADGYVVYERD